MAPIPADSLQTAIDSAPCIWWPNINETASIVAVGIGVVILIMAQFAGARDNKTQIFLGMTIATLMGIFTMPLLIKLGNFLGIMRSKWGGVILLVIMMIYVAAIAVNVYELTTVTAKEARPPD